MKKELFGIIQDIEEINRARLRAAEDASKYIERLDEVDPVTQEAQYDWDDPPESLEIAVELLEVFETDLSSTVRELWRLVDELKRAES
tara:strand:+ start:40 stop:303 length:264 start_codon:yes stop_codon:yes gene_type:complete